ncbi:MAG: fused isobutyryl-CoA mutase/GTPase IcmF [Thermodesulfobacteriota bacterium]|nr:fused isobutyryl-CoA mutase/GTPase IcmF [Thermodesulfobacteriota bacterium]
MDQSTYKPKHAVRVVTATSLFDGHDAAINIMRRMLQDTGVEVIHLGHNRSATEIVDAAVAEDAHGIAVSSYQGGHMEFFKYVLELLKEKDAAHIRVFGGGGGVIVPEEIRELEACGVTKIYSPDDGAKMGLQGMINHMVRQLDFATVGRKKVDLSCLSVDRPLEVARMITRAGLKSPQSGGLTTAVKRILAAQARERRVPVVGITGTGGAGKSSLTDELILRFLMDTKKLRVAVLCVDPSRRKSGGALLGDRIRMNAITDPRVYMRSLATRASATELPPAMADIIHIVKAAGFDLVMVETAGIGQGDSRIHDLVDVSLYVMTSEFGAASQLEKIDMLDFADIVAINKFDKQGSEDALRDVRKQLQRNRKAFDLPVETMPVFGTMAARFNDDGVTALYHGLLEAICQKTGVNWTSSLARPAVTASGARSIIVPPERVRYLSDIADTVRAYHGRTADQAEALRACWHLEEAKKRLAAEGDKPSARALDKTLADAGKKVTAETLGLMKQWDEMRAHHDSGEMVYTVRGREIKAPLHHRSLSGTPIPRVSLPDFADPGQRYQWMRQENLPGRFPYTAGVYPLKRSEEDPTRMFAGEGDPARTNRRFKLLSENSQAKRLSTAFDSVTLYGYDPEKRPDIYGKVGTSGVSVCTLDDVKTLYDGFDLCAPNTSVSMTINGPAPIMLAMFFNAAIDQQKEKAEAKKKRKLSAGERAAIGRQVLSTIRGTVQADILKEDQGQNTCIFSVAFALKMMGDIQEFFIKNRVRNFYSVSVSGYHIAEAGANPITQLAFTLANGFTYLEYYLSRGMDVDSFAPNFSFFFSNGMDPEYTVIGRVARRIWAVALKEKYGAAERSRMLKYHIQTSGRSLHSREIQFNDIRTTLQALCAIYDNCNSLHTNAYDEAITTPSDESVRRALAIQQIINREWGLAKNENPNQGSFIVEELTKLVEEAVLMEFDRITARGGVLGAMETGYQRSRIQEESMHYERLKHTGELPVVGVNTFLRPDTADGGETGPLVLARATEAEKKSQLRRLAAFHKKNANRSKQALEELKQTVLSGENIFEQLMETVRFCSLGQITQTLYRVGGQYRRGV